MITAPRVLVTGAGGFLGAAVARELAATGARVRALVRRPDPAHLVAHAGDWNGRIEIAVGSLGENGAEAELVTGCDIVVHAAGALRGSASTLVRHNAIATRRLVRAATRIGVRRFVLVSSLGVYGTEHLDPGDVLDERCPVAAASTRRAPYIYSKIVQEQVCWDEYQAHGLPLVVIRPGVIFGPGRSCLTDRVGPRVGRWVALIGPSRPLPYTFVRNCARAVALAATAAAAVDGDAFNIVDDELPTGRDIVHRCRRAGVHVRALPVPSSCAPPLSRIFDRFYRWSDGMLPAAFVPQIVDAMYKPLRYSNERAKRRLGWRPIIDLRSAFDLTFGAAP